MVEPLDFSVHHFHHFQDVLKHLLDMSYHRYKNRRDTLAVWCPLRAAKATLALSSLL
jgi:hypothetical protein